MSTPSNSGLRRLVECDKRNSPLLSLLNAPTVGDTASEAQADEPLAVQADFPNDGDDDDDDNYNGLDFKPRSLIHVLFDNWTLTGGQYAFTGLCVYYLNSEVIWGKDRSAYENEAAHLEEEEKYMDEWRKYGPVGLSYTALSMAILSVNLRSIVLQQQPYDAGRINTFDSLSYLPKLYGYLKVAADTADTALYGKF
ncbi:hypothetical protein CFE70_003116 [Pyrenophora teres f. teres 0-1]